MQTRKMMEPPATIGMLGGGQLGRMSAMAAKAMGYRVVVLTPDADSPCEQVCDAAIVAPYDDERALNKLLKSVDVVTYEFENVPATVAAWLEERTEVHPSSRILHTCRHRVREKRALQELGVPVTDFAPIHHRGDLHQAAERLGFPSVLKTATGGYDGKGQRVVQNQAELERAYDELGSHELAPNDHAGGNGRTDGDAPLILEAFVPFERELSVIVARNAAGQCATFPVAENVHRANILHSSIAPAPLHDHEAERIRHMAETIASGLDLIGVMGIELFAGTDFLLVNELAPRPHNSGHYSVDACITSQFEQHIRAVCNLPLGSTHPHSAAAMINVLGKHLPRLHAHLGDILSDPRVKLHLYGKGEPAPQRKMGHLTVLADDVETAAHRAHSMWSRLVESAVSH